MRILLTADQFRWVWLLTGGDAVPMPIQTPGRGRMVSDRDRIRIELDAWWAANEDADVYAAVRSLRLSAAWLRMSGFPLGGKPIRGLLGVGGGGAVLAVQDAMRAVLATDSRDWFADTAIDPEGWSLERGGDVLLRVGHADELIEELLAGVPVFGEGATPALRGEAVDGAGFTSRATTTSKSERITALLGRPRTQYGFLSASVTEGVALRDLDRRTWFEVTGDGGYLVEQESPISLKPAAHAELAVTARQLLASAEAAARVI